MIRAGEMWAMSEPKSQSISIGRRSRYAPLDVTQGGDLSQVIATYDPTGPERDKPRQFMLVLGDDLHRFALKTTTGNQGEVAWVLDANAFSDIVEMMARATGLKPSDTCRDVVIRYRVFSRPLGGEWDEHLHGPLTFRCGEDDSADAVGKDDIGNDVSPGGDGAGPFDGNYAPSFE